MSKPCLKIFVALICVVCIYACNTSGPTKIIEIKESKSDTNTTSKSDTSVIAKEVLKANHQILTAIKNKDYKTFATFIHPTTGIRFSPNAYLDSVADQTLSVKQFSDLTSKNWKQQLVWENDMEGKEVRLTVGRYFEKYLNDVDFSNAPQVAFNKIFRSEIDRKIMKEVYGNVPFIDNHFPGFDKKYGEMDWLSLRLVFEKLNGKYFLIGIIRDQWEI